MFRWGDFKINNQNDECGTNRCFEQSDIVYFCYAHVSIDWLLKETRRHERAGLKSRPLQYSDTETSRLNGALYMRNHNIFRQWAIYLW